MPADRIAALGKDTRVVSFGPSDTAQQLIPNGSFAVIDRLGRIRGTYDTAAQDWQAQLEAALENVGREPSTHVYVPAGVREPAWLAARAKAQMATAPGIAAPHDFHFTDRLGASGITFTTRPARRGALLHGQSLRSRHGRGGGGRGRRRPARSVFCQPGWQRRARPQCRQGRFEDITEQAGVRITGRACVGVAFADIDNDGDADLYVSCVRAGNVLFQNDGKGHFTDITGSAGVGGFGTHSSGVVFFDYDGDGLLDLFVTNVGKYTREDKRADGLYASMRDAFAGHLHADRSETSILYATSARAASRTPR
jgi:hypothetical protein